MRFKTSIISFALLLIFNLVQSPGSNQGVPNVLSFSNFCKSYPSIGNIMGVNYSLADEIKADGEYLTEGSFGKIYEVFLPDQTTPKMLTKYAVKVMQNFESNQNEINILLELKEIENVPKIYRCDIVDGYIYIQQTLLYRSLYDETSNAMLTAKSLKYRASLFRDILITLDNIHKAGIIHGDIKFENLMFDSKLFDSVYIIDFGLSRKRNVPMLAGTIEFMSPEIIIGGDNYAIDELDDLWAFVMTIIDFELSTSFNLSNEYKKALNAVMIQFDEPELKKEKMDIIVEALHDIIEEQMNAKKLVIGQGCPGSSFSIYKNVLRAALHREKSLRLNINGFIGELDKIIADCDFRKVGTSAFTSEQNSFSKIAINQKAARNPFERLNEVVEEGEIQGNFFLSLFAGIAKNIKNIYQQVVGNRESIIVVREAGDNGDDDQRNKKELVDLNVPHSNEFSGINPPVSNHVRMIQPPPFTGRTGRFKIFRKDDTDIPIPADRFKENMPDIKSDVSVIKDPLQFQNNRKKIFANQQASVIENPQNKDLVSMNVHPISNNNVHLKESVQPISTMAIKIPAHQLKHTEDLEELAIEHESLKPHIFKKTLAFGQGYAQNPFREHQDDSLSFEERAKQNNDLSLVGRKIQVDFSMNQKNIKPNGFQGMI